MFTDSEGHFEFTLPQAAPGGGIIGGNDGSLTWLMARKPGFLDDRNGRAQIRVSPGSDITIPLTPEALIKGRVSLSTDEPTRGINVQLFSRQVQDGTPRWRPLNAAVANSNGEFRFAELQPGSYKVFTREWMDNDPEGTVPGGQRYGFPPVYYPRATDFATASTIQLAAGQIFEADMSLVRQPYYPVKIPVTNAEQNGGMSITVSPQGQRGPGYSLGYNRSKNVIDGQLPNGKYLVEASSFGPNSASGSVNLTVAGAPAEGPTLALARNNSITVNVQEEFTSTNWQAHGTMSVGGKSFAMPKLRLDLDLRVEAVEDDFQQLRGGSLRPPTGTNDDLMVLENLAPGRYWLRPHAQRGYVASATMGGTDLLHEPLVVVPGASTPIDITMRDDSAEIEGTLIRLPATPIGSGGNSLGFIYCIPLPNSTGQLLGITASADGKFDYQMVAPGVYRVIAFSAEQHDIPYRDPEAMKIYEQKGQVVHFEPGQKVSLQLQIISGSE
jgi:hypothetical protein